MNLMLNPIRIESIYDELDTNAINFILDNGYFSIQAGVYLEEDEHLNEPIFEFNDQGDSQNGGVEKIVFGDRQILLVFQDNDLFLKKYKTVELMLSQKVDRKIVDFFANCLFLGNMLAYENGFDESSKVIQTKRREGL